MTRRGAGAGLALAVAAGVLAGCGGGGDDAQQRLRERVDAYAKAENRVMSRLAPDVERINRDYVAFSKGELRPREAEDRLRAAEDVVREARTDVEALRPPAEARDLQALLEDYMDETVGLAVQARRLAGYEPAARAALAPLAKANRTLRRELADAPDPQAQVGVLRDYADALGGVVDALEAVEVPDVQRPAHRDQLRRIGRTRALADRLREALADEDAGAVAAQLTRFRDQSQERVPTRRLTRRGLAAYEERVDALRTAALRIRREQIALYRRASAD